MYWKTFLRVQDFVGYVRESCQASDDVPIVLVIGRVSEEGGAGHDSQARRDEYLGE